MLATTQVTIEYGENGDTFVTTPFQLLQWKHALGLEEQGMTMSRGRKVSTHLRKMMGLKRSITVSYLKLWVTETLEQVNKQLEIAA